MRWSRGRTAVAVTAVALGALFLTVTANSFSWIGRTFPGFMVMSNRVVPSIALPHWMEGDAPKLFQSQVVEVDGSPVASSDEVYARVAARDAGARFEYRLRSPSGAVRSEVVPSHVFSPWDYGSLFGAYLLNGLVFTGIGLLVLWLKPSAPASRGFAVAVLSTGVFVTTAADLYGPHWFFRLHVAAETFMGTGFLHLALVFPTDRLRGRRASVLQWLYGATIAYAAFYEASLGDPTLYTVAHLGALGLQVSGCAGMIGAFVYDYSRSKSPLVRRRIQVVTLGVIAGMLGPVALWAASAVFGGSVSMNWAALTAFLFPLSVAYAVVQQDLFEIDVVVRRAAIYTFVVVATVALYVAVLGGASWAMGLGPGFGGHTVPLVLFNVAMLFALSPIRAAVQDAVDGYFFRRGYDPQAAVRELGEALEAALRASEVVVQTRRVLRETFWARQCLVLSVAGDRGRTLPGQVVEVEVSIAPTVRERLAAGQVLARYEWDESDAPPAPWSELAAELLVPVLSDDDLAFVVALAKKESGRAYNMHDSAVLRTMSGQISLAMATARAFGELEDLNASLERQVRERTRELAVANTGLRQTLAKLEQNQESLMRADRLATLGRLAAGMAHEVNTPLGAVLNSLQSLKDLAGEYEESIRDAQVTAEDHAEIAKEILQTTLDAEAWARRAATYVSRMKGHGRDPGPGEKRKFTLGEVVSEVDGLLAHRLRASGSRIDVDAETARLELFGDPSRLTHVLMNVVDNAIGAYEEQESPDGRIEVRGRRTDDAIALAIRDHAGGVSAEIASRIFDEMFTTKERGKGTGLGLWIARNVVERSFRGSLDLGPVDGDGACFVAVLRDAEAPGDRRADDQASTPDSGPVPDSRP